jgi:hypothetical protein
MGVKRFSIWNEPNLSGGLFLVGGPRGADYINKKNEINAMPAGPAKKAAYTANQVLWTKTVARDSAILYGQLYRTAFTAIRKWHPDVEVLIGELTARNSMDWLRMALNGKSAITHGFALHPYQMNVDPNKKDPSLIGGIGNLPYIQAQLQELHSEGLLTTPSGGVAPLFLTEWGYARKDGRTQFSTGELTAATNVPDETTRAAWVATCFKNARKVGARQLLYFQLQRAAPTDPWDTSVLDLSPDGSSTTLPIFDALRRK